MRASLLLLAAMLAGGAGCGRDPHPAEAAKPPAAAPDPDAPPPGSQAAEAIGTAG